MNAQDAYEQTAVNSAATLKYDGTGSYEAFRVEVDKLQALEGAGRIHIQFIHHEQQTGARNPDLVRFTRLA